MENGEIKMKTNILYEKAFEFSVKIVRLYKKLCKRKNEYILSKQILKSGTSIAANIKEGEAAQSKRDFISKNNIALKEARETEYWIDLHPGREVGPENVFFGDKKRKQAV